MKQATFAAGCFWGVEARFRSVSGVRSTVAGYTGGTVSNPTYVQVCGGTTGHVEAVRLDFESSQVSYTDLLAVFWGGHDPTTVDRQGPDHGSQYRSVIFFHDAEQEALARESKLKMDESGRFHDPIVTRIVPAQEFFRAEEYHQCYHERQHRLRFR